MSDRTMIDEQELNNVVGGALRWKGDGTVYPKDNPSAVYHYADYAACLAYIKTNWHGGAQNQDTLEMLKAAKLVW